MVFSTVNATINAMYRGDIKLTKFISTIVRICKFWASSKNKNQQIKQHRSVLYEMRHGRPPDHIHPADLPEERNE